MDERWALRVERTDVECLQYPCNPFAAFVVDVAHSRC